ncbi:hypothetical protein ACF1A9_08750 [Streptomyces sp. NPDC014872]|uniref:hypothetical protein n=1 Tax=Streptomyces sp. NPDC014872 TaxID=3364926 RepID=UPI0036FC5366
MSEDGADLHVPPEALAAIAKGIDLAHAELKDLGMVGEASAGRGFSDLGLSGLELGHGGLASEFRTFCDRWEWGVRALTQKGNNFALGVGLSAGAFAEQEQYVKDSFKIGVNSLNGNPHLSEDEVKTMNWDTVRSQSAYDNPDFSGESALKAYGEVTQTWRDTGQELGFGSPDSAEDSGLLEAGVREAAVEQLRDRSGAPRETAEQAERQLSGQGD